MCRFTPNNCAPSKLPRPTWLELTNVLFRARCLWEDDSFWPKLHFRARCTEQLAKVPVVCCESEDDRWGFHPTTKPVNPLGGEVVLSGAYMPHMTTSYPATRKTRGVKPTSADCQFGALGCNKDEQKQTRRDFLPLLARFLSFQPLGLSVLGPDGFFASPKRTGLYTETSFQKLASMCRSTFSL